MTATATMTRDEAIDASRTRPFRFVQVHNPAFWLYIWLVANGAYLYILGFTEIAVRPSAIVLAVFLETLYVLPLWWFITKRDHFDREPAKLAVVGFVWGGLVATWMMAAVANPAILSLWSKLVSVDFATSYGPALTAPFTEESSKLAGVVMLVLLARHCVRSAYDGMILGAFVGLGFQVFENVEYITSGIGANFNQNPVQDAMLTFILRSSTFYTHAVYTAIAGAGLGYFLNRKDRTLGHRWSVMVGLVLLAMVIHGLLDAGAGNPAIGLVAGPVSIIAMVYVFRFADRGERQWVHTLMADEVANGIITADELDAVAGRRKTRKEYLKAVKAADGKPAKKQAEHVLDATYDLATAIAVTDDPHSPQAEHARAEVQRVRAGVSA